MEPYFKFTRQNRLRVQLANTVKSAKTSKTAVILEDGFDAQQLNAVTAAITEAGGTFDIISKKLGRVSAEDKSTAVNSTKTYATAASVTYDAVFVPGGKHAETLKRTGDALHFINEAYKHFKTVGLGGEAAGLLTGIDGEGNDGMAGVVKHGGNAKRFAEEFIKELAYGRHFERGNAVAAVSA